MVCWAWADEAGAIRSRARSKGCSRMAAMLLQMMDAWAGQAKMGRRACGARAAIVGRKSG